MWHQVIKPNGPIELSCSNVPGGPGLYYLVDPVVSSEVLVKSRVKFFLFCWILWFDWTGWTVGSIGLSGFVAIDSTGSMIQRTLRFHWMHWLFRSLDSVLSLDFVIKLANYKEFAGELNARSWVAVLLVSTNDSEARDVDSWPNWGLGLGFQVIGLEHSWCLHL